MPRKKLPEIDWPKSIRDAERSMFGGVPQPDDKPDVVAVGYVMPTSMVPLALRATIKRMGGKAHEQTEAELWASSGMAFSSARVILHSYDRLVEEGILDPDPLLEGELVSFRNRLDEMEEE